MNQNQRIEKLWDLTASNKITIKEALESMTDMVKDESWDESVDEFLAKIRASNKKSGGQF